MKTNFLYCLLFLGSLLMACEKTEMDDFSPKASGFFPIGMEALPEEAVDYLNANFSGLSILKVEKHAEIGFKVLMNNQLQIVFDTSGSFLFSQQKEDSDDDIPVAIGDLPASIRNFVSKNYPELQIVWAELDEGTYEIYLNNGWELYFDQNGNFIRADRDDDWVDPLNLPEAILLFIQNNYPNATIIRAEFDEGTYEVLLSNRIELYFDQNGNFLFSEID
ncbi:MAG: PepSY-like domain-containing protein [Saprospiraceae bacterium]|nr:PepSY-like domain-containing protein [Saprospiraceae bacterium]